MNARILVIHNLTDQREQLKQVLEVKHRVTLCDGINDYLLLLKEAEAMELSKSPFDLIISAVHLQSDDGLTVFDLLNRTKENRLIGNVPFILLDLAPTTTERLFSDAIRIAADGIGATAFLSYPTLNADALLTDLDAFIRLTSEKRQRPELLNL